jgi:hypothetical protein
MTAIYNSLFRSLPLEAAEKEITFFRDRESYLSPYQVNPIGIIEIAQISQRFFQLKDKDFTGDLYLKALREIVPLHRQNKGQNWTHLCFELRPVVYHVIQWQKLRWISTLFTSPEGASWLNQSYHPSPSAFKEDLCEPEYPIHTAVRIACAFKWRRRNSLLSEQVVEKLIELQANVNQVDSLGRTPLHIALLANKRSLIQLLIEKNAVGVRVDCPKAPLSRRQLFILHQAILDTTKRLISEAISLPAVITNIFIEYLF